MTLDQQLEKFIQQANFLALEEKNVLLGKILNFDNSRKEKLLNFLMIRETKNATLNLKHLAIFQKNQDKWQDIFNKVSQLAKQ